MLKFKLKLIPSLLVLLLALIPVTRLFVSAPIAYAATSPTLSALSNYSVLGGQGVTCTGATTTSGAVGVSPGTSITGFPSPCTAGGGTESNTASAIAAQAEALSTYSALDQTCDITFGAVDLTVTDFSANGGGVGSAPPGVYCSTSAFSLSGTLTLTGTGVHIFKTASTLITSSGSSVTGGNSCNVWWRVGSSATLGSTTSFKGNVFALNGSNAMNSSATLDGRFIGLSAATMTLNANTISGPTCAAASAASSSSSLSAASGIGVAAPTRICEDIRYAPTLLEYRRISSTSIYLSWTKTDPQNDYIIYYGLEDGVWLWNTLVQNQYEVTLSNLPPNRPIWVQVAATDNCAVGSYSNARLVGSPGLPAAGIGPSNQKPLNNVLSNIFNVLSRWFL